MKYLLCVHFRWFYITTGFFITEQKETKTKTNKKNQQTNQTNEPNNKPKQNQTKKPTKTKTKTTGHYYLTCMWTTFDFVLAFWFCKVQPKTRDKIDILKMFQKDKIKQLKV